MRLRALDGASSSSARCDVGVRRSETLHSPSAGRRELSTGRDRAAERVSDLVGRRARRKRLRRNKLREGMKPRYKAGDSARLSRRAARPAGSSVSPARLLKRAADPTASSVTAPSRSPRPCMTTNRTPMHTTQAAADRRRSPPAWRWPAHRSRRGSRSEWASATWPWRPCARPRGCRTDG